MKKSSRSILFMFVILFVTYYLAYAETSAVASSDSNQVGIHHIDFEEFCDGIPIPMLLHTGATTGEAVIFNSIEQDTTLFTSGRSSLRISATEETDHWQSLSIPIPEGVSCVTVRMDAKGEGLMRELNQFGNCYAGFWHTSFLQRNSLQGVHFPTCSFDWTEFTVSFDIDANMAEEVRFTIFSSISGSLWIDNLVFTYDEECPEAVQSVGESLASYITDLSRPTTYLEVLTLSENPCPDSISEADAMEDIQMIRYLFENAYSGYAYWENQGVDFSAVCDSLYEFADGSEKVAVVEFEKILTGGLSGIQDGHFSIAGHDRHRFLIRNMPFFTDVLVERSQTDVDDYTVVRSSYNSVRPGMLYAGTEEGLFRILSRSGVEQFQLGIFTSEKPEIEEFQFFSPNTNDSTLIVPVTLPVHPCRLTEWEAPDSSIYSRTVIDGVDHIRIASFRTGNHEEMQQFIECGQDLADSERFIVNLMGNGGGSSYYPRDFVLGFNDEAHWKLCFAALWSPAIIGSYALTPIVEGMPSNNVQLISSMQESLERIRERPMRGWLPVMDEVQPRRMGNYDGLAVFMMDRGVASSGEALIDYSRSVPGAVLVGENSAGVGEFGEVRSYGLPNSLIRMRIPSKLFLMEDFEEGTGFLPDYWLDSSEPVKEVIEWLNNPDDYQFELPTGV